MALVQVSPLWGEEKKYRIECETKRAKTGFPLEGSTRREKYRKAAQGSFVIKKKKTISPPLREK